MNDSFDPQITQRVEIETQSDKLVVGRIPFLVCAPYFFDSLSGLNDTFFQDGIPTDLNTFLAKGLIDCAPSSSIEYARNYKQYYVIPNFSTGGRSKIKSVLFLSNEPWEKISNKNVILSPQSSTSNILFQLFCQNYFNVDPVFNSPDQPVGRVAIGDEALHLSFHGNWKYCYDLAEIWYQWQGLPFSFGLWMVRKDSFEKKSKEIHALVKHLDHAKNKFLENIEVGIEKWQKKFPLDLPKQTLLAFFESADYRLTPNHEKSLRLFFDLAYKNGLAPKCEEIIFMPNDEPFN